MKRYLALLLLALLVPPTLGGAEPDPEPISSSKTDLKNLQGTWDVVAVEMEGKPMPPGKEMPTQFVFKKNQIIARGGRKDEPATIKIDARKKPRALDISPDNGGREILKGVYRLTKDELTLVFARPGKDRPAKLNGGPGLVKVVLKRQKAKK